MAALRELGEGNAGIQPSRLVKVFRHVAGEQDPSGDKLEARFRGPSITPGYWREPDLTRTAFDEEGFYRSGDAMRFADPANPQQGLEFDGRTAEDFKLTTGTWVSVGTLRARINAAGSPYVQDAVITGHDRDALGALLFPNLQACRRLCPELPASASAGEVLEHASVRARFQRLLDALAHEATGSSTQITGPWFSIRRRRSTRRR